MQITIGTRGSKLALWQANHVADALRAAHTSLEVELEIIKTSGDRIQDRPLYEVGGKGLFIKEIEEALMDGRVDVAVHSMKDMPAMFPPGLKLGGLLKRASPMDALVCREKKGLLSLPVGATVGTSSLRRQFQLLHIRPDLKIKPLRGNVDTRLRKLEDPAEGLDAIVLAQAGLDRLGFSDRITQVFGMTNMFPAIGQGAMGLEIREGDDKMATLIAPLRHKETEICVLAERGVLERLEGDCKLPLACHAVLYNDGVFLQARLGLPDASEMLEDDLFGPADAPRDLGMALGAQMLKAGADELMEELERSWGSHG